MAVNARVNVISVPADTGSIICGKHRAPQALLDAGLVSKLQVAGYEVSEINALPAGPAVWEASLPEPNGVRNEAKNIQVYHQVKDVVSKSLSDTADNNKKKNEVLPFNLVIGGGCDILPSILSAYHHLFHRPHSNKNHQKPKIGLIYIDADTDLARPEPDAPSSLGTLASMTMTHLLQLPGVAESMRPFTRPNGTGVVDSESLVMFGLNTTCAGNTKDQLGYLLDEGFKVVTSAAVARDPVARAREALEWLEKRVDMIFVHLDVDAIDAAMFPLANVLNFTGAGFEAVMGAVDIFLESEKTVGLCVGEVNPDHDPTGEMVGRLVERVVGAISKRKEG